MDDDVFELCLDSLSLDVFEEEVLECLEEDESNDLWAGAGEARLEDFRLVLALELVDFDPFPCLEPDDDNDDLDLCSRDFEWFSFSCCCGCFL